MRFVFLFFIRLYKLCLSPLLPAACRFTPTCSDYARDAIAANGAVKGGMLAAKRIFRCHPWGKSGFDPVPCRCDKETAHE
jgi:putative membrane protein insertion efficiency factor